MTSVIPKASTATPDPSEQRDEADDNTAYLTELKRECERLRVALQLTDTPSADLPEIKTIDGRVTCLAWTGELGVALDEVRITYRQAAVFITSSLETEALGTADPAETLGNILDALPEVMPEVFHEMGTAEDLAEALRPEITNRVRFIRDLYRARATADPAYAEILDIMLDATRDGADPADVSGQVLELLQQARAEKAA